MWNKSMSEATRLKSAALLATLALQALGFCVGASSALLNTTEAREIKRLAKAAEMRNLSVDKVRPCDDFYQYACGNWAKINPANAEVKTGVFNALVKAHRRKAQRLLSRPLSTDDSGMARRVKYFFQSCQSRRHILRNQRARLLVVLEEFGGMPAMKGNDWREDEFDWLEVVAKILRKYGKKIIFDVNIAADLKDSEMSRLYIGQPDEMVTTRASEFYAMLGIAYELDLQRVLGLSTNASTKIAKDLVSFEYQLAAGISEPSDGLGMEEKTRLRHLDEMSEEYKPTLNLTRFVSTWLGYDYLLPVNEYVESYFSNLSNLIQKTPKRVLANYILWELAKELDIKLKKRDEQHALACVDKTLTFFRRYVDRMVYKSLPQRTDIDEFWLMLKQAFSQTLESKAGGWLSEETRQKALEKLAAMTIEITSYEEVDFEKEFAELVISTEDYFQNVENILKHRGNKLRQQVNAPPTLDFDKPHLAAYYASEFNKVYVPVSFLLPGYLWSDDYPMALKFATLGFVLGHEIAHGFDDTVRKYDAKGNLKNWWDRNSTEEFTARRECLHEQFSEYRYNGARLPKSNAMGEHIADNVGVRIAYTAYKEWLQLNLDHAGNEALPNLKDTGEQLFFLGLTQLWCSTVNEKLRNFMAIIDVHAPDEVRVHAILTNFDEFAHAYQCEPGSHMHPSRKCVIY